MPTSEGESSQPAAPKRAKRGSQPSSPVSLTPTDRLDAMTRERIDALESDNERLRLRVAELQGRVDELAPANARLIQSLDNAESNGTLSTILIAVSGFAVSYAAFTEKLAGSVANLSAGCLMAGIVMMIWQSARRWRRS
ncbi:MAG: hypothetical protein U0835_02235 [Isosphaeraceae bacterium]